MSLKNALYEEMGKYMGLPEGHKVVSINEETYSGGYCETCYYEEHVLRVGVEMEDGEIYFENEYFETIGEFINAMERQRKKSE